MRLSCVALLPCVLALPCVAFAQSEDRPWQIGASLGYTQVSNLYRNPDPRLGGEALPNDDHQTSVGLFTGASLRASRQRLRLDASATQNRYRRNKNLDYLAFNGQGTWAWALGRDLAGELQAGASRTLAPFNPGVRAATNEKNIDTGRYASLSARYGLFGAWSVDSVLGTSKRDYTLPEYDAYEVNARSADLGLRWQPSPKLGVRLAYRAGRGDYPRAVQRASGVFEPDHFERRDVDALISWSPAAHNTLSVRVGNGKTEHSQVGNDTKGTNWRVDWAWVPTGKLRVQALLSHDNGADTNVQNSQTPAASSLGSRLYDNLSLQVGYAVSAKVSLSLSASESRRDLARGLGDEQDSTRAYGIGLNWSFVRNGSLGCQYNADQRRGTVSFAPDYNAHSSGCTLRYTLD
jgi:hypothetical protein